MAQNMRGLGIVIGANVEALVVFYLFHQSSLWLNANYPRDGGWQNWAYLSAMVVIGVLWFRMFSPMVRQSLAKEKHEDASSDKKP